MKPHRGLISAGRLAAFVAAVGLLAWVGSIIGRWWDLLTAWLVWGSVVLAALIYELRRPEHAPAAKSDVQLGTGQSANFPE